MDTGIAITGLTRSEVEERRRTGRVNFVVESSTRTTKEILKANVVTRFNIILSLMLVVILIVAPIQDALFGMVMVINSAIGIVQELRARRKLDALRVVVAPKAEVIRDGKPWTVRVSGLVTDDVVVVRSGDQVPVDGEVIDSNGLEFDESLLTGESDSVAKRVGDNIMSGSFVVAGSGKFRATDVGNNAYAVRLATQARTFSPARLRAASRYRQDLDLGQLAARARYGSTPLQPATGI